MITGCTSYDLIIVSGAGNVVGKVQETIESASDMARSRPSPRSISGSECMFRFGSKYSSSMSFEEKNRLQQRFTVYLIVVHPITGDTMRFPISPTNTIQPEQPASSSTSTNQHDESALIRIIDPLSEGVPNKAHYILVTKTDDEIIGIAPCDIFVWHSDCKVAVVDVDGTITTSTLTGFWNTAVMHDFSSKHCHNGVCRFLSNIVDTASNVKLRLLYLTNRPITYVDATRNLLMKLKQDTSPLPRGPLIGFMGELAGVFKVH
jgi:LNS2 (Lipin/Ned1/Smp2)